MEEKLLKAHFIQGIKMKKHMRILEIIVTGRDFIDTEFFYFNITPSLVKQDVKQ